MKKYSFLCLWLKWLLPTLALAPLSSFGQGLVQLLDPNIKSVQVFANQNITSFPSATLGTNETVTCSFDDLAKSAPRNLTYRITHCDEGWNDENLHPSVFIDGFQENPLYCKTYSNNTTIRYVHYSITFPNNDVKLKISGNYMLTIIDSDSQEAILRVGFMLSEKSAIHNASVKIPSGIGYETSHQLLLDLRFVSITPSNPSSEIKTKVYQNFQLLPQDLQPLPTNITATSISYSRSDKNVYLAGNEYRSLDIRDVHYVSTNVRSSKLVDGEYFLLLNPDTDRYSLPYSSAYDYNGKMIIAGLSSSNPDSDCDYYNVLFSLGSQFLGNKFDVYVEGELSGWSSTNANRMMYNNKTSCYELPLILKQGFYGYRYVVRDANGHEATSLTPEGNFSQTENSYQVCSYYKGIRDLYTRLVASTTIERDKKLTK